MSTQCPASSEPASILQFATAHHMRRLVPGSHLRGKQLAWYKEQKEVRSVTSRVSHLPESADLFSVAFPKFLHIHAFSLIFRENRDFSQVLVKIR